MLLRRMSKNTALTNVTAALKMKNLDAFLVPSSDAHGSEYVSKHDERRAFVSNFDGSAGLAAIVVNTTDTRMN